MCFSTLRRCLNSIELMGSSPQIISLFYPVAAEQYNSFPVSQFGIQSESFLWAQDIEQQLGETDVLQQLIPCMGNGIK